MEHSWEEEELVEAESFQVQQTLPCFFSDVFQVSARLKPRIWKQTCPAGVVSDGLFQKHATGHFGVLSCPLFFVKFVS